MELQLVHLEQALSFVKDKNLSKDLLFEWQERLKIVYPGESTETQLKYLFNLVFEGKRELITAAELPTESLALVYLLLETSKDLADFQTKESVHKVSAIIERETSDETKAEARQVFNNIIKQIDKEHVKPVVYVGRSLLPLAFDFTARIGWLILYNNDLLSNEVISGLIYFIGITSLSFLLMYLNNKVNKKRNEVQLEYIETNVLIKDNTFYHQYVFFFIYAFLLISGFFVFMDIQKDEALFKLAPVLILNILPAFVILSKSVGRLPLKKIMDQLNKTYDFSKEIDADKNDEIRIGLSSATTAISSRLDAYVLESALFGALAFSGFLQIMAELLVTFDQIESFGINVYAVYSHLILNEEGSIITKLSAFNTQESIFTLISMLSLLSSVLFLMVIATRLRLSDILDVINKNINLASEYNEKEEELLRKQELSPPIEKQLQNYNRLHSEHLKLAAQHLLRLEAVTTFMRFFRNAGVVSFFAVLISSALLVSPILSTTFLILSFVLLLFFNWKYLVHELELVLFKISLGYKRLRWILLASALLVFLAAFFVNYGSKAFAEFLVLITALIIIGFRFVSIIIHPIVDKRVVKKPLGKVTLWFWFVAESLLIGSLAFYFMGYPDMEVLSFIFYAITIMVYIFLISHYMENVFLLVYTIIFLIIFFVVTIASTQIHLPDQLFAFSIAVGFFMTPIIVYVSFKERTVHAFIKKFGFIIITYFLVSVSLKDLSQIFEFQPKNLRDHNMITKMVLSKQKLTELIKSDSVKFRGHEYDTLLSKVHWLNEAYPGAANNYRKKYAQHITTNLSNALRREEKVDTFDIEQFIGAKKVNEFLEISKLLYPQITADSNYIKLQEKLFYESKVENDSTQLDLREPLEEVELNDSTLE